MTVADVITAISVAVAAISFVVGVSAWKREFVGRRRIELAETTLARFYEASAVIQAIRNPFSKSSEGTSRKRVPGELPEQSEILDQAYVVFERYDARKELFAEIQSLKYRFMAAFGRDAGQPFDELRNAVHKIFVSARMLGRHFWQKPGRVQMSEEEFQKHLAKMKKHEAVFWDVDEADDEIRKQVDEAVEKIERIAQKAINGRRGIFRRERST